MDLNNAVILNRDDHSIGDLPPEILRLIFKSFRGSALIRLTSVCKNFNETIGNSSELMDKIRLKVMASTDRKSVKDLSKMIKNSSRNYEQLAINNVQIDDKLWLDFIKDHRESIRSLKLSTCHFASIETQVHFMKIIAPWIVELELENVIVNSSGHLREDRSSEHSVTFWKLQKLKCSALPFKFICNTLKSLQVHTSVSRRFLFLLEQNPAIEELTVTYEVLDSAFRQNINEINMKLQLKKLQVLKHHGSDPIDSNSNRNFLSFLRSQSETLEEVVIDWFSGKPPERRESDIDLFEELQFQTRRSPNAVQVVRRGSQSQRRRIAVDNFDASGDICVRTLQAIFLEFKRIRKLIVSDKQSFLSDSVCPTVQILDIVPNYHITELRLRFEKSPLSNVLFEKLVSACPNVKYLFVHEMDQNNLECVARVMKNVESIFALSLNLDVLPCDKIKLKTLQRLNFCECHVANHPEIIKMKSLDQKSTVLSMMK